MHKEVLEQPGSKWLNDRKDGIGGSDISAILGLNPFKSRLQLWMDKTGRNDEIVDNNFTRAGVKMEPMVAEWFEEETGLQLINPGNVVIKHAIHPWVLGTPDRKTINPNNGLNGRLEIKTTGKPIDRDNLPLPWFCQVNWYAGIELSHYPDQKTDTENFIAWFERMSCAFDYVQMTFDPAFFQYLIDQAGEFWNNYVLTDTPPPATSKEDVNTLYKQHLPGKSIIASEELKNKIAELIDTQKVVKNARTQEDKLKLDIQLIMQDAEAIYVDGYTAVTWKSPKDSIAFDEEKFKNENPELYSKYLSYTTGSRRFLVKK